MINLISALFRKKNLYFKVGASLCQITQLQAAKRGPDSFISAAEATAFQGVFQDKQALELALLYGEGNGAGEGTAARQVDPWGRGTTLRC